MNESNESINQSEQVSQPDQSLSKKQRRRLKKQQKEKEHQFLLRKKRNKKIIITSLSIAVPIIIIVLGILFSSTSEAGRPKLVIEKDRYDAGTVSMADKKVKHIYEIKNTGEADLKLSGITTSCMCTTAILTVGDKVSPKFGMHDNPLTWSEKIAPGETGFLEVIFDQAFHGLDGVGSVVRAAYITTNDPQNRKAEVTLLADVVR